VPRFAQGCGRLLTAIPHPSPDVLHAGNSARLDSAKSRPAPVQMAREANSFLIGTDVHRGLRTEYVRVTGVVYVADHLRGAADVNNFREIVIIIIC
jgi:hypothetical protein